MNEITLGIIGFDWWFQQLAPFIDRNLIICQNMCYDAKPIRNTLNAECVVCPLGYNCAENVEVAIGRATWPIEWILSQMALTMNVFPHPAFLLMKINNGVLVVTVCRTSSIINRCLSVSICIDFSTCIASSSRLLPHRSNLCSTSQECILGTGRP